MTPLHILKNGIGVKCEDASDYGSYKVRGIRNLFAKTDSEVLSRGLVTVSAGNMARALAGEAQKHNLKVTAYIPETTPLVKKTALHQLQCEVIEKPFAGIWEMVENPPVTAGVFVHPQHPLMVEGYETIYEEVRKQNPQTQSLVVPFGCGGLLLGMLRANKKAGLPIEIYAAEGDHASPLAAALESGEVATVERRKSFIDAIGTPRVLTQHIAEIRSGIGGNLVISQEEARLALKELYLECDLKVEGAAGVAYAAAQKLSALGHKNVVAILSGGNIDAEVFSVILSEAKNLFFPKGTDILPGLNKRPGSVSVPFG